MRGVKKKDMEQNNDIVVANNRKRHHQKTLFTSQTPDGKKECNMLKLENLSARHVCVYGCVFEDLKTLKCFENKKQVEVDTKNIKMEYYVHKLGDVRLFENKSIVLTPHQHLVECDIWVLDLLKNYFIIIIDRLTEAMCGTNDASCYMM
jgi:hypothetical protein